MGNENSIGGVWLATNYGIDPVMPFQTLSRIGSRRATQVLDDTTTEIYVESMRPSATLRGHLTFHLKHEVPHLELLSQLFRKIHPQELSDWVADEPSGQYAKRAGFLYEFLTNKTLEIHAEVAGGYIDVLDAAKLVVASPDQAIPNRRWRVRDNLPGTTYFCPIIRKTADSVKAMSLDVSKLISDLALEFGEELLMRSAVWMTLRESKSSFAIEGEADQSDRIQRFADVLSRRTGKGTWPLDQATLSELQAEILGKRTTLEQFGVRESPVFVGEVARYQDIVHYIAPPAEDIKLMLEGLVTFLERTKGQSPIMRSAVVAFGFVYIHPLADGNGRVHRFLINDILRRDQVVKAPMILPISSLITSDHTERHSYDRVLDVISSPLMRSLEGLYEFAKTHTTYSDGIRSNFVFHGDDKARHTWRYLDLTKHVIYLAHVLERTICEDMREESRYLRNHSHARIAIKDIVEMPDIQIDRVIRSVESNHGKLSNMLGKEIPILQEPGIWDDIVKAIENAFQDVPEINVVSKYSIGNQK
ncbi:Fic family protein [Polynucleobacter rarus]|uniref:Fic family protein n=1 Tax=Polynucleobacter rarus TaxID=556055 RepID=UPI000D3E1548|nr:Fic family protein [Polynucleobacter rarus]